MKGKMSTSSAAITAPIHIPLLLIPRLFVRQPSLSRQRESGELAYPEVVAASRDRVALDSVGVALLRHFGAESPLNRGAIFDQEQLKRAVELGLGVKTGKEIQFLADDKESRSMAAQLENALKEKSL
jgi:hypothetical protein